MPRIVAYGSNMSFKQMQSRCPSASVLSTGKLEDYSLCFPRISKKRQCGVASICRSSSDVVEAVVYDISDDDLVRLDKFEGLGSAAYRRELVDVVLPDANSIQVWAYIANGQDGGPFKPSPDYMDTIIAGANEHGLSPEYIAILQAIATS